MIRTLLRPESARIRVICKCSLRSLVNPQGYRSLLFEIFGTPYYAVPIMRSRYSGLTMGDISDGAAVKEVPAQAATQCRMRAARWTEQSETASPRQDPNHRRGSRRTPTGVAEEQDLQIALRRKTQGLLPHHSSLANGPVAWKFKEPRILRKLPSQDLISIPPRLHSLANLKGGPSAADSCS